MTSRSLTLLGVGCLVLGSLFAGCGKRSIASKEKKTEFRDHGTACLRVTGAVFQGPGMRTVEATVTAPDRRPCTEYDLATCSVERGDHGEILIRSTLSLFPPYGLCGADGGAMAATCHAVVAEGDHDIVFGRKRERRTVSEPNSPICLDE